MLHPIVKYLLPFFFGALIFPFPVYQSTSEIECASSLSSQISSEPVVEGNQAELSNHQTSTTVTFKSRSEIYEVILGTFMIIVG